MYAAASTRDALRELAVQFEREHNATVVFNFGGSGDLARQIIAAAKADIFLSADELEMDRVDQAGLLEPGTRRAILSNHLVVIEPADGSRVFPSGFSMAALKSNTVRRVSLADVRAVPAGRYAKSWLEKAGVWDAIEPKIVPGVDVRAALSAVESGAAQVGVVYRTDASISKLVRVVHQVPDSEAPTIRYVAAGIRGRAGNPARALLSYLVSDSAVTVFSRHGFMPLPPDTSPR